MLNLILFIIYLLIKILLYMSMSKIKKRIELEEKIN